MKKEQNQEVEIAVIFKKRTALNQVVIYKPKALVIGHLNNETNKFVTINNETYSYMLDVNHEEGFGLRLSLKVFKEFFKKENISLKESAKLYLKDLKAYEYYFYTKDIELFTDLSFRAKNKLTRHESVLSETDIILGQELLLRTKYPDRKIIKKQTIQSNKEIKLEFDAKKLSDEVKSIVIGQDSAIDDIVTIIWQNFKSNTKSNILLIGPTGVGKTEIIRNISKKLNVPIATINVANVSVSSYAGPSLTEAITKLVKNANNDIEKASHGIIFIDEIDKKTIMSDAHSDILTTGVQDELLKLLEDNDYEITISDNNQTEETAVINTKNITFICAGAFADMKKHEIKPKTIGFALNDQTNNINQNNDKTKHITHNDLVKYGLKPELVGRLHNIIELSSLSKDNLITIMKNPNNQTIQEKIKLLNSLGIKLNLEEEVYEYLADTAIKKETGARGLVSTVDSLFLKAMKEISQHPKEYQELIINKETAANNNIYKLIKRRK